MDVSTAIIDLRRTVEALPEPYRTAVSTCAETLTQAILEDLANRTIRDKITLELTEKLSVDIQYLALDCEATRRERDNLQRIIDNG